VPIPVCHCSRCHSGNTIRVQEELQREHWYCYDCGRGFDVPKEITDNKRLAAFTRLQRSPYN